MKDLEWRQAVLLTEDHDGKEEGSPVHETDSYKVYKVNDSSSASYHSQETRWDLPKTFDSYNRIGSGVHVVYHKTDKLVKKLGYDPSQKSFVTPDNHHVQPEDVEKHYPGLMNFIKNRK